MNISFNPIIPVISKQANQYNQNRQQAGFSGIAEFHNPNNLKGELVECLKVLMGKEVTSFARKYPGLGQIAEQKGVKLDVTLDHIKGSDAGYNHGMAVIKVKATTDTAEKIADNKNMHGSFEEPVGIRAYPSLLREQQLTAESSYVLGGSGFRRRDINNEPTPDHEILCRLIEGALYVAKKAYENLNEVKEKIQELKRFAE